MIFLLPLLQLILALSSYAVDAPPCTDSDKVYKVCSNQQDVYSAALAQAKADKKHLVVVLGAEWCPWCLSLHRMLEDPAVITPALAKKYSFVYIALYQAKEKLLTGIAVQERVKLQAGYKKKLAGVPIMALVSPKSSKAIIIDTEPLEKNTETSKGHDSQKVLAALAKAEKSLK